MKDELWMQKIKERLEDYSEPLPASGWERLEKDLSATKFSTIGTRRVIPLRRWAVVAAAVLLVAVSSVSLWLQQSSTGEEIRKTSVEALAVVPDDLPKQPSPAVQTGVIEPLRSAKAETLRTKEPSLIAQHKSVDEVHIPITENTAQEDVRIENESPEKEIVTTKEKDEQPIEHRRPSGKDKLHLPIEKTSTHRTRSWSVGLAVNTGGLSSGGGAESGDMLQNSPYPGSSSFGGKVDLTSVASSILNVPEDQELIFKNGVPYLQKRADQIASISHKQPLSFGFSVRKGLSKGFSIETGLTYTYLSSDVKFERSTDVLDQKLHYLGIPLRANWNFIDKKSFTVYVSAGGAMEKCVYGKIGNQEETIEPLQFSLMGALGAQYNVSRRVGLYLEPGVSYFFNDGSMIETIRKENPFNFTLQAGVRLTY